MVARVLGDVGHVGVVKGKVDVFNALFFKSSESYTKLLVLAVVKSVPKIIFKSLKLGNWRRFFDHFWHIHDISRE